ncbi:hypothetical protein HanXRQr2_Chr09g0377201 [Helianthus annuus]|uniref:Uncharacterized protein n=1 Tax=Helianthus annuus TaxID=4232 RepID=A0A9K3I3T6_HELAN|nr:hypothetical protein HanXRQr2_Chr09g0377201 [Helianthus annuus]KAJ0533278.1 hypothetical protein HanIR_Chr09g0406591 [Helianthus annuus]KAJ0892245.1 hypothetical protein HanPSC8_Chr09g0363641 [Helianthus annuus]
MNVVIISGGQMWQSCTIYFIGHIHLLLKEKKTRMVIFKFLSDLPSSQAGAIKSMDPITQQTKV